MTDKLVEQTERALQRAENERAKIKRRHVRELKPVDDEIRRLRASLRSLTAQRARPKRTARVQAGPKAINLVTKVLRKGPRSFSEIVNETGLHDGSVSYALRALREDGEVVETPRSQRGAREYRFVQRRAVRRR